MFLLFVLFFVCMSYQVFAIQFNKSIPFFMIVGGMLYVIGALIAVFVSSFFIDKHPMMGEFSLTCIGIPAGLFTSLLFRSIWRDSLENEKNTH